MNDDLMRVVPEGFTDVREIAESEFERQQAMKILSFQESGPLLEMEKKFHSRVEFWYASDSPLADRLMHFNLRIVQMCRIVLKEQFGIELI